MQNISEVISVLDNRNEIEKKNPHRMILQMFWQIRCNNKIEVGK